MIPVKYFYCDNHVRLKANGFLFSIYIFLTEMSTTSLFVRASSSILKTACHPLSSFCLTLTWLFSLGLLCSPHFTKLLCSPLSVSPCPSARWHSILSTASIAWPRAAEHTNCCCALSIKSEALHLSGLFSLWLFELRQRSGFFSPSLSSDLLF